jgi:hypothetical protein
MRRPTQTCAQPPSPLSLSANSLSFSPNPSQVFTVSRPCFTVRDIQRAQPMWFQLANSACDRNTCRTLPSPLELTLAVESAGRMGNEPTEAHSIRLIAQPCYFGGYRFWFGCPSCLRRVYTLYIAKGVKCRTCAGLRYCSRNWSSHLRLMHHYTDLMMLMDLRPGPRPRRFFRYDSLQHRHGLLGLAAMSRSLERRHG